MGLVSCGSGEGPPKGPREDVDKIIIIIIEREVDRQIDR